MPRNDSTDVFFGLLRALWGLFAGVLTIVSELFAWILQAATASIREFRRERENREELQHLSAKHNTDSLFELSTSLFNVAGYPSLDDFMEALYARFCEDIRDGHTRFPHYEIRSALISCCGDFYITEGLHRAPPSPPATTDEIVLARYRDQMSTRLRKAQEPKTLEIIDRLLRQSVEQFIEQLPLMAIDTSEDGVSSDPKSPLIGLFDILPDIPKALSALTLPLFAPEALQLDLFKDARAQLAKNADALGIAAVEDYKGDPKELAEQFLKHTPFAQILTSRFPFILPEQTRFAGHWIVAPPGRGKTTLLHGMIIDDLSKDAALVVIDSKGDLIDPLKTLACLKDRLLLIEPNPDAAFALNPLDISNTNVTQAVSLIEYIMAGLLDAKFTALQSTLFRNVVPAIIEAIPNPTLNTFKDVMVKGLPTLQNVSPHARQFFEDRQTGFFSKTYESTRKEVVWRLDYLMTNPILRAMFSASHTKLDMGTQLDAGKVIIINNSKAILGDEGAEFFGRFFVALIARAAQQRAGKPAASKKPCYVYIDECQSVICQGHPHPNTPRRMPLAEDRPHSRPSANGAAHGAGPRCRCQLCHPDGQQR